MKRFNLLITIVLVLHFSTNTYADNQSTTHQNNDNECTGALTQAQQIHDWIIEMYRNEMLQEIDKNPHSRISHIRPEVTRRVARALSLHQSM